MDEPEILLLQLELPIETIVRLLERLPRDRPTVILDPSPAQDLSRFRLDRVDVLTPNKHEILRIGGSKAIEDAADELLGRGVRRVLCTQGEQARSGSQEMGRWCTSVRRRASQWTARRPVMRSTAHVHG